MKNTSILSMLVLLLISGCAQEHKVEHSLNCVLKSVVYTETGKEVVFKREDAIKNGYEYFFRVYGDGIVVVNDVDVYVKDKHIERSYSLKIVDSVNENMKFQFTKEFDDVRFVLVKKHQEYTYSCSNIKEMVNK